MAPPVVSVEAPAAQPTTSATGIHLIQRVLLRIDDLRALH
ncbi:hypothetical protein A7982_13117 [Minicystis rosea]|nr:hypothetical protein A7982_13117 [Minicystis rosea]